MSSEQITSVCVGASSVHISGTCWTNGQMLFKTNDFFFFSSKLIKWKHWTNFGYLYPNLGLVASCIKWIGPLSFILA